MIGVLGEEGVLALRQAFAFVWVIVFAGAFMAFATRLSAINLQDRFPSKDFVAFPTRRQCHAAMTFCIGNIFVYAWGWLFLFMQSTGGDMTVVNSLYFLALAGHVVAIGGCIWCVRVFVPDSLPTLHWILIAAFALAGLITVNLAL
jgi:hypothetical protein